SGRPKLPAIMLGDVTQKLLADVFRRPDLFAGLPRIKRRVVAWGQSAQDSTVPHSAVVVSEEELWRRIRQGFVQSTNEEVDWTIFASFSMPSSSIEHHFGSRMAQTAQVKLREHHDAEACWIESAEKGWLFLLPAGEETGWLLSVGGSAESLLEMSALV